MAVTKTHPIKSTLKAAIGYICNPEKTGGKLLASSYGCAAETADIEFAWTRRHAIDKGTNLGRHLIQAFQPGEVTPDQERFTRLKTLGVDYTEEALAARIAGCSRPSHQPKPQNGKISLLIDIQNNIKAQQSAGYRRWATIENLKRIADTSNFLTEHGIGSYEELLDRCEVASASAARLKADLRDTGAKIDELALKMKHVAAYRQLKPIYDRYKASRDKEKFLRGHESEIILFEAAARECKRLGAVPLPATERMQAEIDELNARKAILKAELQKAQRKEQDYAAMRQNVEDFLSPPQPERERKKNVELE